MNEAIKEIDILIEHLDGQRRIAESKSKFNQEMKYSDQINILEVLKNRIRGAE